MKLMLLILALSLCAAAQTTSNVSGVTLSGDPSDPIVQNNSGKTLLWVRLDNITNINEKPWSGGAWFISTDFGRTHGLSGRTDSGLPSGVSSKAWTHPRKTKVLSSVVISAVFADGEFRGKDNDPVHRGTEIIFQSMRETWQQAKDGQWDKVQAKADKWDDGIIPQITAKMFLAARSNAAAMAALDYIGNLPASTWTAGTLINRRIPVLQLIAQWFSPMVAHAQCILPTTCPPWSSGTVIQYPQSGTWVANCDDYSGSPDPCPALMGTLPWTGIAAYCTGG